MIEEYDELEINFNQGPHENVIAFLAMNVLTMSHLWYTLSSHSSKSGNCSMRLAPSSVLFKIYLLFHEFIIIGFIRIGINRRV